MVKYCKCVPFPYRRLLESNFTLPYCNISNYAVCQASVSKRLPDKKEKCNKKWEYEFYKWSDYYLANEDGSSNLTFGIEFAALDAPYVGFTIQMHDTPEKFLSQVGGLVNFYLGVSGLSVCAFVIHCCERYKKWRSGKRPEEDNGANSTAGRKSEWCVIIDLESGQKRTDGQVQYPTMRDLEERVAAIIEKKLRDTSGKWS